MHICHFQYLLCYGGSSASCIHDKGCYGGIRWATLRRQNNVLYDAARCQNDALIGVSQTCPTYKAKANNLTVSYPLENSQHRCGRSASSISRKGDATRVVTVVVVSRESFRRFFHARYKSTADIAKRPRFIQRFSSSWSIGRTTWSRNTFKMRLDTTAIDCHSPMRHFHPTLWFSEVMESCSLTWTLLELSSASIESDSSFSRQRSTDTPRENRFRWANNMDNTWGLALDMCTYV